MKKYILKVANVMGVNVVKLSITYEFNINKHDNQQYYGR
jgi:hypothetical protein